MTRGLLLLVLTITGFVASLSSAQTKAQWEFSEGLDALTGQASCVAAISPVSQNTSGVLNNVEIRFVFSKNQTLAPTLYMIQKTNDANTQLSSRLWLVIDKKNKAPFVKLESAKLDNTNQTHVYWYPPMAFEKLVQKMLPALSSNLSDDNGNLISEVSLIGITKSIEKVKSCVKDKTLYPTEFFSELNADQNFTRLWNASNASPDAAYAAVNNSFQLFLSRTVKEKELEELKKQFTDPLKKLKSATDKYNLALATWNKTNDSLTNSRASLADWTDKLNKAKAELDTLKQQLALAQADLAKKKAEYDRVKAITQPLDTEVEKLVDQLLNIRKRIKYLQERISYINRKIPSLNNDISGWEREASSLRPQVDSAKREMDDAEQDYRRFDVNYEFRQRLSNDFSYRNAVSRRDSAVRDLENYRREYQYSQDRLRRAEHDLSRCMNRPHQFQTAENGIRPGRPGIGDRPGFGDRPNPPHRPPHDPPGRPDFPPRPPHDPPVRPPEPPRPPNCTSEEQAVRQAQSEVQRADSQLRSAQYSVDSAEQDMNRAEQNVRREVEEISDRLRRIYDDKYSTYSNLQSRLNGLYNAISSAHDEIASLRREKQSAESELPKLQSSEPQVQSQLTDAQNRLAQLRRDLDFDRIETEYLNSSRAVDSLNAAIKSANEVIKNAPAKITTLQKEIAKLEPVEAKQRLERDKTKSAVDTIEATLADFRKKEADINQVILTLKDQFNGQRLIYKNHTGSLLPVGFGKADIWMLRL